MDKVPAAGSREPAKPGNGRACVLSGLLLIFVNLLIFYPSFVRVFADDHILYVAELRGSRALSAGLNLCDYSLARQYSKGDEILYRPLLFAWMALENTLFGNEHVYWNAMNFVLHCGVALMLWRLLDSLQHSVFSFLFALIFSVLTAQVELVIWSHLGGYLWACIWILSGLHCARKISSEDNENRGLWLVGYAVSFALGAFFYEFSSILAVLSGIYLAFTLRKAERVSKFRLYTALLAPLVIYAIFYIPHAMNAPRFWYRYEFERERSFVGGLYSNGRSALKSMYQMLKLCAFPNALLWQVQPFHRFSFQFDPWKWTSIALVPAFLFWISLSSMPRVRKNAPLIILLITALFSYAFMTTLGRKYVPTYYNYVFDMLGILVVYSTLDFSRNKSALTWKLFAGALLIFGISNAFYSLKTSEVCHSANQAQHQFIHQISAIVQAHRAEPGPSFGVENAPADLNPVFSLLHGYPDAVKKTEPKTLAAILFAPYFDTEHPRYQLEWDSIEGSLFEKKARD